MQDLENTGFKLYTHTYTEGNKGLKTYHRAGVDEVKQLGC